MLSGGIVSLVFANHHFDIAKDFENNGIRTQAEITGIVTKWGGSAQNHTKRRVLDYLKVSYDADGDIVDAQLYFDSELDLRFVGKVGDNINIIYHKDDITSTKLDFRLYNTCIELYLLSGFLFFMSFLPISVFTLWYAFNTLYESKASRKLKSKITKLESDITKFLDEANNYLSSRNKKTSNKAPTDLSYDNTSSGSLSNFSAVKLEESVALKPKKHEIQSDKSDALDEKSNIYASHEKKESRFSFLNPFSAFMSRYRATAENSPTIIGENSGKIVNITMFVIVIVVLLSFVLFAVLGTLNKNYGVFEAPNKLQFLICWAGAVCTIVFCMHLGAIGSARKLLKNRKANKLDKKDKENKKYQTKYDKK